MTRTPPTRCLPRTGLVTAIGLDVTSHCVATHDDAAQLASSGQAGRFLWDISRGYEALYRRRNQVDGCCLHDVAAAAYLVAPELFALRSGAVRVVTEGIAIGQSIQKPDGHAFGPQRLGWSPLEDGCRRGGLRRNRRGLQDRHPLARLRKLPMTLDPRTLLRSMFDAAIAAAQPDLLYPKLSAASPEGAADRSWGRQGIGGHGTRRGTELGRTDRRIGGDTVRLCRADRTYRNCRGSPSGSRWPPALRRRDVFATSPPAPVRTTRCSVWSQAADPRCSPCRSAASALTTSRRSTGPCLPPVPPFRK